jgi:CRISPR-associated protein Csb2
MPTGKFKARREDTTLVFDTWAQIDDGELAIRWDVELAKDEEALLRELAANLGYLGRSESWVEARLASDTENFEFGCQPDFVAPSPGPGWEQVSLLAPIADEAYTAWAEAARAKALAEFPLPEKRKPSAALVKKRDAATAPFPADLCACLQADTTFLRAYGWSQPPGSRRVMYWRRSDALRTAIVPQTPVPTASRPTMALVALSTGSGNFHALPMLDRSLPQGELLHRQLVGIRSRVSENHSPVLTGCDETGQPLRTHHVHAHVLSLDLDDDGHIDHVLIWAPQGFDEDDLHAIRAARQTHTRGSVGPLRLGWAGCGKRTDMARLGHPLGEAMLRVIGESTRWISATPFVAPRYVKPHGPNALNEQVRAELSSRGIGTPVEVKVIDPRVDDRARRQRHHIRVRRLGIPPPVNAAFTIELVFAQPVAGPLCLGYGSHFGLGRFECANP